jgi:hypothetical protein
VPAESTDDDVPDAGPEQDLRDGNPGRSGTGDHDVKVGEVAAHEPGRVDQGGKDDDGGAVLVVVEDRDVEALLQTPLDLEAPRRGDVLQVDPAVGGRDAGNRVDELIHRAGLKTERNRVDAAKSLEQHGLSLHHRHRGERPDVAEAEDGGAVADDSNGVAHAGVGRGELRVGRNGAGDLGDARRVQQRQVCGVAQRLGAERGQLSAQVGAEHRAGGVDERRGLRVHEWAPRWLSGRRTAFGCGMQPRCWPRGRARRRVARRFRHCARGALPSGTGFPAAVMWLPSHPRASRFQTHVVVTRRPAQASEVRTT